MSKLPFVIDSTVIKPVNFDDMTYDEAQNYRDYVEKNVDYDHENYNLAEIRVFLCDDNTVYVDYRLQGRKFERIRRITGK